MEENILDKQQIEHRGRRRDLLPRWIKFFVWVFLVVGIIVPVCLVFGAFGMTVDLALYGLETIYPLSPLGLFITGLFALKGIVAFSLWTEKTWAIKSGIVDAILGITTCLFLMFILPLISDVIGFRTSFRMELLFLIPYLWKMITIKTPWETIEQQ